MSGDVVEAAAVAACEAHTADQGDGEPDQYDQLNLRFHVTIAEASGNPFLADKIKMNARKVMASYRARIARSPRRTLPASRKRPKQRRATTCRLTM